MAGATPIAIPAATPRRLLPILLAVGRVLLGLVFIYAAYTKLSQPWMLFAMSIDSYQMLPTWASTALARGLPWAELLLGIALIAGWKLHWFAVAASVLLAGFFTVMVVAYARGLGIDCGCFGIGEKLGPRTLIRDGLLVALALGVTAGAFLARRTPRMRG
jgi:uncharacterized membrane protein YphA (DoxX/SURF4 family)